jgi:hypothetical protein
VVTDTQSLLRRAERATDADETEARALVRALAAQLTTTDAALQAIRAGAEDVLSTITAEDVDDDRYCDELDPGPPFGLTQCPRPIDAGARRDSEGRQLMTWRQTQWADPAIEPDDFLGGTRVRLTFPDGSIIIGKLTVEPQRRVGNGASMIRLITAHSGDTWVDAYDADVEVWVTEAFNDAGTREEMYELVASAMKRGAEMANNPEFGGTVADHVVDTLLAEGYVRHGE